MKKNKKNDKEKGFTITELLGIISILSLLLTIVIYASISVIGSAKEKTYNVTVNNIQTVTSEYLLENSDRLFYINKDVDENNIEYQCVTVKDLVETGYFKNDIYNAKVKKNRYVLADDYVYIERDKTSKTVSKIKYLLDDEYVSMCDKAVKAISDVSINVIPDDWSAYKDITIKYRVKNYFNINNYTYHYSYSKPNVVTVISDNGDEKKLKVTDNGIIKAWVEDENGNILDFGNEKVINKIDNETPVIIAEDIEKVYNSTIDLFENVTIIDNSGMDTVDRVYYNGVEITDSSKLSIGNNILYYESEDKLGNISEKISRNIRIIIPDEEFDYLDEDQPYPVPVDGVYIIEAYGAQGGNSGGKGGYVKAEVSLKFGDNLIINTGGINGYNGGGGYGNSKYYPGGGATTVRYNDNYIIIAGGGGAKGSEGEVGLGGTGDSNGGDDVGGGAGLSGYNGGGGSNSLDYNYKCNCDTCGGGCASWTTKCTSYEDYNCNCRDVPFRCNKVGSWCDYVWACDKCQRCISSKPVCSSYHKTYKCNCDTCIKNGYSGNGGTSSVSSEVTMVENIVGNRVGNGYVKIRYKMED